MQIDVSERITESKRITAEWASAAGYKQPEPEPKEEISERVRNVRRVLGVSSFGCQDRNVHMLCEALIGEKIPMPKKRDMAEFLNAVPFAVGSVLVPVDGTVPRPGIVTRSSVRGNAGLRWSNGDMHPQYSSQRNVRPATDEEIDTYFAEFFGVEINPLDASNPMDDEIEELGTPF